MNKKTFMATIIISVFLISTVAGMEVAKVARANPFGFHTPPPELPPIYITQLGDVEPSNASISHVGEMYTFTSNITGYSIVVQRGNIVIDGAGYTLQGLANRSAYIMHGVLLTGIMNITIKNIVFEGLDIGVDFENPSGNAPSHDNLITQNVFLDCTYGTLVDYQSFNNTFSKNTFTELTYGGMIYGVSLYSSNNNSIVENRFMNVHSQADSINAFVKGSVVMGCAAIGFQDSSYNTIVRNDFENNTRVVELIGNSRGNLFCQNNFINSSVMLLLPYPPPFNCNSWDNGSQGNYWSDYTRADSNNDGIGDTPYAIDGNNTDMYPLMNEINTPSPEKLTPTLMPATAVPLTISILSPQNDSFFNVSIGGASFPLTYETNSNLSWVGYSIDGGNNVTLPGNGTYVLPISGYNGYNNLTLYANDTSGNWATPQTITYLVNIYPDYTPTPSPSPTQQPATEPGLTVSPSQVAESGNPNLILEIATVTVIVAIVVVGFIVYFKKRRGLR